MIPDDQAPFGVSRTVILVLVCVGAFVLSALVLTRQLSGTFGDQERLAVAASSPTTTASRTKAVPTAAPTAAGTPAARPTALASGGGEVSGSALAADAESCRLANLRHQAPLSAAEVSLAQFDKHIDAMNLLVAGKISLSVATTFWDETRVKAVENAAAFRRADKVLKASAARCEAPDPDLADAAPYGQVVTLKSCVSAIAARDATLARARTAVTTWEHHVHDMEMLRLGHITPAQATAAWQKSWKTGQAQLKAYEKAAAKAAKIPCTLD
jgi:hypothetical protein